MTKKKEERTRMSPTANPEALAGYCGLVELLPSHNYSSGKFTSLLKWKRSDEVNQVPARQANSQCPRIAIRVYGKRLTWHINRNNEDNDKKGESCKCFLFCLRRGSSVGRARDSW